MMIRTGSVMTFLPPYSKQVESDAKNVLITRFPPGGIILNETTK